MVDSALQQETEKLTAKLAAVSLPAELRAKAEAMIDRLALIRQGQGYSGEYDRVSQYLDWIIHLPWQITTGDRLDLGEARKILDRHHYGMNEVKERILQYLATMSLTKDKAGAGRAPILCLVGLVGTGKTTFGPSLAEALGRKYVRIPFGGLGSALDLRGQSRLHPDAEPGLIIKALRRAGSKNPVMLLDEIDRVTEAARADIMGVLVELLDPEQNAQFTDHYLDYPFDLTQVLFVATGNNTKNVATAVLDRLEIIRMPSYTDGEKIAIAKDYMLPKILTESGLTQANVTFDEAVWPKIVRPLGFDAGMRTLERTLAGVAGKLAKEIVAGKAKQFHLTPDNIKNYLPDY